MKFDNVGLRAKLGWGFLGMMALAAVLAWVSIAQVQRLGVVAEDLAGNWLPSIKVLGDLREKIGTLRRVETQALLGVAPEELGRLEARMVELHSHIDAAYGHYLSLVSSELEGVAARKLRTNLDAYFATNIRTRGFAKAGDSVRLEGANFIVGASRDAFNAVGKEIDELIRINQGGADTAVEAARSARQLALRGIAAALFADILIGTCIALWLAGRISRPIHAAVHAAREITAGNLAVDIPAGGKDESGQLLIALAQMRESLARTVADVRINAESVATASAEIAQGTNDLGGRTERQASALEQTAASMEQLGATVRQNADNAQEANRLATQASIVAERGGSAVNDVAVTMDGINESSRRIADIVGVIDSIAFQTNILALNAAVEAARAGEQGRGFSVVASEVRTLAGRSADAAREIKGLIDTSVQRMQHGAVLARRAGETMVEIVASIGQVSTVVAEISTASREQSEGVSQVGEAVTQMDQATQQNAALVEESAAAAESLRVQAEQLLRAVSIFRLSGSDAPALGRRHAARITHN